MATKVKRGDLVCLYRRKEKGVGIILETATLPAENLKIIKLAKKADWNRKAELKRTAMSNSDDKTLIEAAFLYNLWQSNAKLKKDFVYIKWLKRPSEYEQTKTTADSDWFPADWVGRIP